MLKISLCVKNIEKTCENVWRRRKRVLPLHPLLRDERTAEAVRKNIEKDLVVAKILLTFAPQK